MEVPASLAFLFNGNPLVQVAQAALTVLVVIHVSFVFFVTRDVIARTQSLLIQIGTILFVAMVPVAGLFLYMLLRPTRTVAERQMVGKVDEILALLKEREAKIEEIKEQAKKVVLHHKIPEPVAS